MAVYIYDTVHVLFNGRSNIELWSGVNVRFCMKDTHDFGRPVFALQNDLAVGNTIPKWFLRSCLGLNLGPNPNHTQIVNLVLNLYSGLVSPQLYCCYVDFFEAIQHSHQDTVIQENWKLLADLSNMMVLPLSKVGFPGLTTLWLSLGPTHSPWIQLTWFFSGWSFGSQL